MTELCDPDAVWISAARNFVSAATFIGDVDAALLAYNGGGFLLSGAVQARMKNYR